MDQQQDFPYYDGQPAAIAASGWIFILLSVVVAFAALTAIPLRTFPQSFLPTLLFLAIPLLALRLVTGQHWTRLFRKVGLKDVASMVAFALLTILGSFGIALLLMRAMEFSGNPVSEAMRGMTDVEFVSILAVTIPQLVGEELFAILPFLAVLWMCVTRIGMPRRVGICIALLVSSLFFGAAHLPTYDWNWGQSLVVIGTARIMLTLAYIVTRNLWVSAGAHILNDWAGFFITFEFGHVPIGAAG